MLKIAKEYKDSFKHGLALMYALLGTLNKDVNKLSLKVLIIGSRQTICQTRKSPYLDPISSLEDLLQDADYQDRNHTELAFLML